MTKDEGIVGLGAMWADILGWKDVLSMIRATFVEG